MAAAGTRPDGPSAASFAQGAEDGELQVVRPGGMLVAEARLRRDGARLLGDGGGDGGDGGERDALPVGGVNATDNDWPLQRQ